MNELEVVLSIVMICVGVLTYAFRNTPNPYIGVRMGYTYLSKEAWRKANTFAGIYCILTGFCLLAISVILKPSIPAFLAVLLILVAILAVQSYRTAKETYEREDLRTPANTTRPLKMIGVKPYLLVQLIPIAFYFILASMFWDRLPDTVAIHFDASGRPDNYADKITGTLVIPLIAMAVIPLLTVLASREPMLIRFPVYGKGQKVLFTLLAGVQIFIVAVMMLALLYNVGMVFGELVVWFTIGFSVLLLIWIGWMWRVYRLEVNS